MKLTKTLETINLLTFNLYKCIYNKHYFYFDKIFYITGVKCSTNKRI
jgi:hypothetical protein